MRKNYKDLEEFQYKIIHKNMKKTREKEREKMFEMESQYFLSEEDVFEKEDLRSETYRVAK